MNQTELTIQPEGQQIATAAPMTVTDQLLSMAIDKNLDIDKLERLMEMKEREEQKTAYAAFVVAISEFQAHCPTVKKTGTVKDKNGRQLYTYPRFDDIMRTIRPHLDKNSLSIRFSSDIADGQVKVHCMVSHSGGHTDDSYFSCPIEASMAGGANASQRTASANSFAKRYAAMNALNIAGSDFDDDGGSLGADIPTITEHQMVELQDHMDALEVDEAGFFNYLQINKLENLPAASWPKAMSAIERKQKAAKK